MRRVEIEGAIVVYQINTLSGILDTKGAVPEGGVEIISRPTGDNTGFRRLAQRKRSAGIFSKIPEDLSEIQNYTVSHEILSEVSCKEALEKTFFSYGRKKSKNKGKNQDGLTGKEGDRHKYL